MTVDRKIWIVVGLAAVALVLGVASLIVGLDARSTADSNSEDSQESIATVSSDVKKLNRQLGNAEGQAQEHEKKNADRESKLSGVDRKQQRQIESLQDDVSKLTSEQKALANQVDKLDSKVKELQRKKKNR